MSTENLKPYNAELSAKKNDSDKKVYTAIGIWVAFVAIVAVAFANASVWGGVFGVAIWGASYFIYEKYVSRIWVVVLGFLLASGAVLLSSNYAG